MWRFEVPEVIVVPSEHHGLVDAMVAKEDVVLSAIDDQQSWAIQLAFRIVRLSGYPDGAAAVRHGLGRLATEHPETFLREFAEFDQENPCALGFCGVIQYFGTVQEIRDRASPRLGDVTERLEALQSVDDAELADVRDSCVGLLQVQAEHIRDSPYPRVLRQVDFDFSRFQGRAGSSTFVVAEATIDFHGKVKSVKILRGEDAEINDVVANTLSRWLFEPMIEDGRPVEFQYIVSVRSHP
jgi:hypothetical protein